MCPACREPLIVLELDGVELDRCDSCHGVWMDAGEMEMIPGAEGSADSLRELLGACVPEGQGPGRCPRCRRRLKSLRFSGEAPLVLAECPNGDGLWAGESTLGILAEACGGDSAVVRFITAVCPPGAAN